MHRLAHFVMPSLIGNGVAIFHAQTAGTAANECGCRLFGSSVPGMPHVRRSPGKLIVLHLRIGQGVIIVRRLIQMIQIILVDGAQFLHQLLHMQTFEFLILKFTQQHSLVLHHLLPFVVVPVLQGIHRSRGMTVMMDDHIVGHAIRFRTTTLSLDPRGFV